MLVTSPRAVTLKGQCPNGPPGGMAIWMRYHGYTVSNREPPEYRPQEMWSISLRGGRVLVVFTIATIGF